MNQRFSFQHPSALVLLIAVFLNFTGYAAGDSDNIANTHPNQSKAIVAAELEKGFQLHARATQTLGVQFVPVTGSLILVDPDGIVQFQDFTAVYRRRDGWIRMVEIEGQKLPDGKLRFSSKDFKLGDEIATSGASELRVIDMDLWGPKADACGD